MWPLLTVETETNGNLWSTNEGVLPWLVRCAHRAGKRDFYPALAALVSPVENIFFLTLHYFNLCISTTQQPGWAGSRAEPPVSECVSLV